jgi:hypothetical protein
VKVLGNELAFGIYTGLELDYEALEMNYWALEIDYEAWEGDYRPLELNYEA